VFEQKQFILQGVVVSLLRHDSFLQCERLPEIHSTKPTHTAKIRGRRKVHLTTYDPQTAVQDAILSAHAPRDREIAEESGHYSRCGA